ncbi:hypothetical protein BC830DRAFT_1165219 [Chytriomyces sp. MP71]|nr:hypothetical protein BC830DRAFT_1165219 [Chytriomyces sp. MP71]
MAACLYVDEEIMKPERWRIASPHRSLIVWKRVWQDSGDFRIDKEGSCALRWACSHGHLMLVEWLLEEPSVDPSTRQSFSVGIAADGGHADILKRLLLDPRVDPAGDHNYAVSSILLHLRRISYVPNRFAWPVSLEGQSVSRFSLGVQTLIPATNAITIAACSGGFTAIVRLLMNDARVDWRPDIVRAFVAANHSYHRNIEALLSPFLVDATNETEDDAAEWTDDDDNDTEFA